MMDLCLRADTERDLIAALPFMRDGDGWKADPTWSLDVIGRLVVTPPIIRIGRDGQAHVVEQAIVADGFFANLRCMPDIAQRVPASMIVTPKMPKRVFA